MDIILWHSILIISVPLSLGLQARWQQICNLKFAVIGNLCITLREQAVGLHDILEKIRSVMLILQLENLRNFLPSKDCIVVLTHIAWAAIVISAHGFSQGLQVGMWHSWLTFLLLFISVELAENYIRL